MINGPCPARPHRSCSRVDQQQDTLLRAAELPTSHILEERDNYNNISTGLDSSGGSASYTGGTGMYLDAFGGGGATSPPVPASQRQQQQQRRYHQQQHPGGLPLPMPVMDRNVTHEIAVSNEEESNLRITCDECTIGKIKCDGGRPCKRCARRGSECIYREKK